MVSSVSVMKDVDLHHTITMLKKNEEENKNNKDSEGCLALNKALGLSHDLEGEEQLDAEVHRDPPSPVVKKKRVYNKKKSEVSIVRQSIRIKLNAKKQ